MDFLQPENKTRHPCGPQCCVYCWFSRIMLLVGFFRCQPSPALCFLCVHLLVKTGRNGDCPAFKLEIYLVCMTCLDIKIGVSFAVACLRFCTQYDNNLLLNGDLLIHWTIYLRPLFFHLL